MSSVSIATAAGPRARARSLALVAVLKDFDRVVDYVDTKGNPYAVPLSELVAHVVNHGTAHRAETGMWLERIARSLGDLDFVYYYLGR